MRALLRTILQRRQLPDAITRRVILQNLLFGRRESGIVWTKRWKYVVEPLKKIGIVK